MTKPLEVGEIAISVAFGEYQLIELRGSRCLIRFIQTGYESEIESTEFRRGKVKDWSFSMRTMIGKILPTINYGDIEILDYESSEKVFVKFLNTGTIDCFPAYNIKAGKIQDYNLPAFCGVGFMGVGKYNSANAKKQYKHWNPMIRRCYDSSEEFINYFDKHVDPQWHNFQNFAEWCLTQKGFDCKGWQLDKDIINRGNKEYGPNNCVFIPSRINSLLIKSPQGSWDKWGKFNISVRTIDGTKKIGRFTSEEEGKEWYKKEKRFVIESLCKHYKSLVDDRVIQSLNSWTFFDEPS